GGNLGTRGHDVGFQVADNLVDHLFRIFGAVDQIVDIGADELLHAIENTHVMTLPAFLTRTGRGPINVDIEVVNFIAVHGTGGIADDESDGDLVVVDCGQVLHGNIVLSFFAGIDDRGGAVQRVRWRRIGCGFREFG